MKNIDTKCSNERRGERKPIINVTAKVTVITTTITVVAATVIFKLLQQQLQL